jgi:TolA-binding protein
MAGLDEYDLEEIKREIVESRALVIKTNNLVNALSADLKSIAKRQQASERQFIFKSATAYVVTIAVVFIALKFAWDARVDAIRAETKDQRQRLQQVEQELNGVQQQEEARARSSKRASEYFALVRQGKRKELIDQYEEISKLQLTRTEKAVFDEAVERARNELSIQAYQNGLELVRTGRWHEAQQQFRESLDYKSDAAHSPQATFQLATALCKLGRQRDAIRLLQPLSEASPDREIMDDATLLLADAQIEIRAWNDAKNTLRSFLRRFPDGPLALDAKRKLAEVQLEH